MLDIRKRIGNSFNTSGKLGTENKHRGIGKIKAVLYLVGGVSVVHGNRKRTHFEYTKVYGEPLKAIHKQNCDFISLFNSACKQEICKSVCLNVKIAPAHLAAVLSAGGGFDKAVFAPSCRSCMAYLGVYLNKRNIVRPKARVFFKKFRNRHIVSSWDKIC